MWTGEGPKNHQKNKGETVFFYHHHHDIGQMGTRAIPLLSDIIYYQLRSQIDILVPFNPNNKDRPCQTDGWNIFVSLLPPLFHIYLCNRHLSGDRKNKAKKERGTVVRYHPKGVRKYCT